MDSKAEDNRGISWRDPSTWLPYLYASLLYYLSVIGAHLPRRITAPLEAETQAAKEVTAPAPADSSLSTADCNCLTPHLCPEEKDGVVAKDNFYVSTLSFASASPKHSALKKPYSTTSIPSSVSFRSITPSSDSSRSKRTTSTFSGSGSDSDSDTTQTGRVVTSSRRRSIRRSRSVITLVPSGSHVLVGIPKLDWKSESIRIKRTRMSEWLDAEERDVMRQFDEVIRSEEEEDRRTGRKGILKQNGSVRSLASNLSASKSTIQETPVFVPPPPPPTDNNMLPRLAVLEKTRSNEEFGFNLHAERGRGHFIGTVDAGGIGERAGLEQEQRIVGVNGQLIYPNTSHKEVVALIKKFPMSTTLLVASEVVDKYHRDNHIEYSFDHVENKAVPEETTHHDYPVRDASNGFEVPALNPHSIQVNEEREIQKMTTTTKTEVISTDTSSYQYKVDQNEPIVITTCSFLNESTTTYNAYAVPPAETDDLMAQVFNSVPLTPVSNQVTLHSTQREEAAGEDASSVSSLTSSHRESAVDVPVDHKYVPSYNSQPHHTETQTHHHHHHSHHQQHQQPSPLSNGSSHGYTASSSSGYDDDDIYHLSAKEARERLRMKNRKHHLHEMSLNEKYQLVSNM